MDKSEKMSFINSRAREIRGKIHVVTNAITGEKVPGPLFDEAKNWSDSRNRNICQPDFLDFSDSSVAKLAKEELENVRNSMENLKRLRFDAMFSS